MQPDINRKAVYIEKFFGNTFLLKKCGFKGSARGLRPQLAEESKIPLAKLSLGFSYRKQDCESIIPTISIGWEIPKHKENKLCDNKQILCLNLISKSRQIWILLSMK